MSNKVFKPTSAAVWAVLVGFLLATTPGWATPPVTCYVAVSSADCVSCYASSQVLPSLPESWYTTLVFPSSEARQAPAFVREVLGLPAWPRQRIIVSDSLYRALGGSDRSTVVMVDAVSRRVVDSCPFLELSRHLPRWRLSYAATAASPKRAGALVRPSGLGALPQVLPAQVVLSKRCTWVAQQPANVVYDYLYNAVYLWRDTARVTRIGGKDLLSDELLRAVLSPAQLRAREQYKSQLEASGMGQPRIEQAYLWGGELWLTVIIRQPEEEKVNGKKGVVWMPYDALVKVNPDQPRRPQQVLPLAPARGPYEPDLADVLKYDGNRLLLGVRKEKVSRSNKVLAEAQAEQGKIVVKKLLDLELPAFYVKTKGIGYVSSVPTVAEGKAVFYFDNHVYDLQTGQAHPLPWAPNTFGTAGGKMKFRFAVQAFGVKGDTLNFMLFEEGKNYLMQTNAQGELLNRRLLENLKSDLATRFVYNREANAFQAITLDNALYSLPCN